MEVAADLGPLSDAEVFEVFMTVEHSPDVTNREARFWLHGVGGDAEELHALFERLAEVSAASDDPLGLLSTYRSYLAQAERQLQSIIRDVSEFRPVVEKLVGWLAK